MTRHMKKVKTCIVMAVLLGSIITSISTISTAGILFNLQSNINVTWSGNATNLPVDPRGNIQPVDIEISYQVTRGPLGRGVIYAYSGKLAFIKLEIIDQSDWVTATLQSDTVSLEISDERHTTTNLVSFQAAENAPAYGLGFIKIKASVGRLGIIEGYEKTFTLNFVASFKPLINTEIQSGFKEIGPMDTAEFPIEIQNLGNARTIVFLEVENIPEGWNAVMSPARVTLEEAEGSTATANLIVKPPKNFGYHFDETSIRISMKPVRADKQSDEGTKLYENFLVQSRGFSTPGFEGIIFVVALFSVILFIKMRKRKIN